MRKPFLAGEPVAQCSPQGSPRDARWLTPLLFTVLCHILPSTASSEETDYLPDSVTWNGLSDLQDLARGSQHPLLLIENLNWRKLPRDATVFLIHPEREFVPAPFIDFITQGGRLLIADDFGRAKPLLQSLGIQRLDGTGIRAEHYHQNNEKLPVATGGPSFHPLNKGIDSILANHPSYFRSRLPTLAGFGAGQQLLVAGRVGKGHFVALSDPSLLINAMLRFAGNRTLALNLIHHLAPESTRPIFLLTGGSQTTGSPRPLSESSNTEDRTQRFMTEYNQFLEHLNSFAPQAHLIRLMTFALGCFTLLGLFLLLPPPRKPLRGEWLHPVGAQRWSFEEQVTRFTGTRRGMNALYPAAILREDLEETLNSRLKAPDPIFTMRPTWVIRQTRQIYGEEAATLIQQILEIVPKIPPLAESEGAQTSGFSPKELSRFYLLSQRLLKIFDALPSPPLEEHAPPASLKEQPLDSRESNRHVVE